MVPTITKQTMLQLSNVRHVHRQVATTPTSLLKAYMQWTHVCQCLPNFNTAQLLLEAQSKVGAIWLCPYNQRVFLNLVIVLVPHFGLQQK